MSIISGIVTQATGGSAPAPDPSPSPLNRKWKYIGKGIASNVRDRGMMDYAVVATGDPRWTRSLSLL